METSRSSKRRRLISSYVSLRPRPDIPAIFESLNDDTLTTVLEFVGDKSYRSFGCVNKRCKEVYITNGMTKETFVYGYAPLSAIIDKIERAGDQVYSMLPQKVGKAVVFYNRSDVLEWALQEQKNYVLGGICVVSVREERFDLLKEVWNFFDDEDVKDYIFRGMDGPAAEHGKLDVIKWFEKKGLNINKEWCALQAAEHGQLHILQWLREEKGFEFGVGLYLHAARGDQLHVMKWLREQGCPWDKFTFRYTARKGNLDVLQWLHDEGCPWPGDDNDDDRVSEEDLKPETLDWCRVNGYGDMIVSRND